MIDFATIFNGILMGVTFAWLNYIPRAQKGKPFVIGYSMIYVIWGAIFGALAGFSGIVVTDQWMQAQYVVYGFLIWISGTITKIVINYVKEKRKSEYEMLQTALAEANAMITSLQQSQIETEESNVNKTETTRNW